MLEVHIAKYLHSESTSTSQAQYTNAKIHIYCNYIYIISHCAHENILEQTDKCKGQNINRQ